jgi:hypothetical protein
MNNPKEKYNYQLDAQKKSTWKIKQAADISTLLENL